MLDYAVLGGIGGALLTTPAYGCIGHYFEKRRGLATGIATTSGALGGIVIPLMLRSLIPKIGFAWSSRALGFLLLAVAAPTNILLKSRLPPAGARTFKPDLQAFKNASFVLCTIGMFLMEIGLFVPIVSPSISSAIARLLIFDASRRISAPS